MQIINRFRKICAYNYSTLYADIFYLFTNSNECTNRVLKKVISIFFTAVLNGSSSETSDLNAWPLLIPVIFGLINLVVVLLGKNTIGRTQLLNCTVLIKYTLIPFFIIGGLCIAVALLLTFTPDVIMIFVGPTVAITLSVLGWFALVGSAPYSVALLVILILAVLIFATWLIALIASAVVSSM